MILHRIRVALALFAVLMVAGCASTEITQRQRLATGRLPRPARILVFDFVATPADLPGGSRLAGQGPPQTAEEITTGRQLGAAITADLVAKIREMGMPAQHAPAGTFPLMYDIIIRGYLVSINEGSAGTRVLIGFRRGKSELETAVEAYQMTPRGEHLLGSGTLQSGGSKTPGAALSVSTFIATGNPAGLIVSGGMRAYGELSGKNAIEGRAEQTAEELAEELKKRFQEEGWIQGE